MRAEKFFLPLSCALVIELFSVALILAFCFRATAPVFHRYCVIVSSAAIRLAYNILYISLREGWKWPEWLERKVLSGLKSLGEG